VVRRKKRTPVVLDTNVFVRAFKARAEENANRRILRLWLIQRQLQLIVSRELLDEYLDIFGEVLEMDDATLAEWQARFLNDSRCTVVGLGRRYAFSRDPDDNLLLAVASSGPAEFLVTNDRDLLELPMESRQVLRFEILRPAAFLAAVETKP
jgi:putative PIN family toxin of toxin-antitoxin system